LWVGAILAGTGICLGLVGCVPENREVVRGQMPTSPPSSGRMPYGPPAIDAPAVLPPSFPGGSSPPGYSPVPASGPMHSGPMHSGPMHGPGGGEFVMEMPPTGPIPTELARVSHPLYTVAPPDILLIDALRLVPKPPYRIEALEVLLINVGGQTEREPLSGRYIVSPEGSITFPFNYGAVRVMGLTLDQVESAINTHLAKALKNPQAKVAIEQFRGVQQIRGEHLVRPDGTIGLGTYGAVYVAGMRLDQVKRAVEMHLSNFLLNPQISVDVFAYNSKKYYVIFDGGGYGQQVVAFPATGNETVLDAISNVYGLSPVSSKKYIWVARPAPCGHGCAQVLPVNWRAITEGGDTCTNYQLFPGDRLYVRADPLICFDNYLAKLFAPIERVLGITLLGTSVAQSFRNISSGTTTGAIIIP
jgi:polysaccharide export outer membrane protein